ncbi:MAG: UPF0182 family protein [Actinomycetota bacterium]
MRPSIPALMLSRRAKIGLAVGGALIVLLIVFSSLVDIYVDWLWFGEVKFRSVYTSILTTRAVLFVIFGLVMALLIGVNLVVAYLLRPPFRPLSAEQQNLERYRVVLEPRKRLVLAGVMAIAGLAAGLAAQGNWRTWTLWRYGGSFGVKDPQFNRDISYFAWDYPVYRLLLGFGFTALFFAIVFAVGVHYLFGAIRLQTPGPKITLAARRHITVLVFAFITLKAVAYWLDRYGLVYSNRGKVTGASYTDVNASLPAKTILFWIAVIIAIGVLASMWLKSAQLPAIGFGVLLVLSIVISGIYPAIVQQFSVKPNASDKEAPFIRRNIVATREAYGIKTDKDGGTVTYQDYQATTNADQSALSQDSATISNIRILDPNIIEPTFTQRQQIRNQYGFPEKLDIDRYTVGGSTRDYVVGVRELKSSNLRDNQTNWINKYTVYTHGYGFAAAQANKSVKNKEDFALGDIPPTGFIDIKQPQVYFGELGTEYSVVGAENAKREYDGSDQTTSYAGKGGVSLGNIFNRLAFAVQYKQTNFLLNDAVSAPGAKIIFNRDPRERVMKVAPFLKVDADPYPAVVDGHLEWIVDGYTTMSNYPYSEQQSLSSLTSDSLTAQNKTAAQPDAQISYIRNSVKATVDAYDGTIKLYAWDDQDPVLKAWRRAFPNLVQDRSQIPAEVLAHVRYPEDLFEVQRELLAKYHVDDPVTFYNVRDQWTVPTDPTATGDQPPYYLLANSPGDAGAKSEFQLTSPMRVNNRENLAAYISVNSDPGPDYGKMTVLRLPNTSAIQGPSQVFSQFSGEPAISRDITLLNQGGSEILHGNLLTLPVGNTFLYVEPLYVQKSGAGGFPLLQAILVYYGDRIGYGSSVADALTHLSPVGTVPPLRTTASGEAVPSTTNPPPTSSSSGRPSTSGSTTTAPPAPSGNPSLDTVLTQLNAAFDRLQAAYKTGDLAQIGAAEADVQRLTQQYLRLRSSAPPSASPTR